MNQIKIQLLLLLLLLGCLSACQDDHTPAPEVPRGVVRPAGTPRGALLSRQIGPEGGVVASADGSISISIPPQALSETITIGIQEIENTCTAGKGKSFRLSPHGQQFKKPVEIKISYAGLEQQLSSTYGLGLAFQADNGIWNYVESPTIAEAAKTVSVQATHFSDWTIVEWLLLTPVHPSVAVGGELKLQAVSFLPLKELETGLLAPLIPAEKMAEITEPIALDSKFVGKWTLIGAGEIKAIKSEVTYKAPPLVPSPNPVSISLEVNTSSSKVMLVSSVTIIGNSIEFRIDGGDWIKLDGVMVENEAGYYAIASVSNGGQLGFFWTGGKGFHPYTDQEEGFNTLFQYWEPGLNIVYSSWYDTEEEFNKLSGGGITITSMGEEDGWVSGSFNLSPASKFSITQAKQLGVVAIEGKFKVKRIPR